MSPSPSLGFSRLLLACVLAWRAQCAWPESGAVQEDPSRYNTLYRIPKLALVYGVANFADLQIAQLANANADALKVADRLAELGFDTSIRLDGRHDDIVADIDHLLNTQVRASNNSGVRPLVAIFIASHGFNDRGRGWIVANDVDNNDREDNSIAIDTIIDKLATRTTLIVLVDACRTDYESVGREWAQKTDPQWVGDGIAGDQGSKITTRSLPSQPQTREENTDQYLVALISYATQLGRSALDEALLRQGNSPFTKGLLRKIGQGGDIDEELLNLRGFVYQESSHRQQTDRWGAVGKVYFLSNDDDERLMGQRWASVIASDEAEKAERMREFVFNYPVSPSVREAQLWLSEH